LLCRWDQGSGKERRLRVFGPALTATITDRILNEEHGAFSHDWKARVQHPFSQQVYANRGGVLPRRPPAVDVRDIRPGFVYEGPTWRVTAAAGKHVEPDLDLLAYRIDFDDGSIVFSGDSAPCDSVIELARGADAMVAMWPDDQQVYQYPGEPPGWRGIIGPARMAADAAVKRVILTHISPHIDKAETLANSLAAFRMIFTKDVVVAEDLMVIEL
jgi:ribonuclease BN (tRNA processing enzyme)